MPDPHPASERPEPEVVFATVRDGLDDWHIECRFSDGQKCAAVLVGKEFEGLADRIASFLNAPAPHGESPRPEGRHELPFDGRSCPMCPVEVRNLSAVAHNLLSRIDRGAPPGKIAAKLHDLDRALTGWNPQYDRHDGDPDRAIAMLRQACTHVVEAWKRGEDWTLPLDFVRFAGRLVRRLSDAHFADRMHSHGEVNR